MENLQPENTASFSSVDPAGMPTQRTVWAERRVEEFLSLPFVSEFVFRSVRTTIRQRQEGVADFSNPSQRS